MFKINQGHVWADVTRHLKMNHKQGHLKPAAALIEHSVGKHLPAMSNTMLAYHVIDIPVLIPRISKERKAKIGPWVSTLISLFHSRR